MESIKILKNKLDLMEYRDFDSLGELLKLVQSIEIALKQLNLEDKEDGVRKFSEFCKDIDTGNSKFFTETEITNEELFSERKEMGLLLLKYIQFDN